MAGIQIKGREQAERGVTHWERLPQLVDSAQGPTWFSTCKELISISGYGRLLKQDRDACTKYNLESDASFAQREFEWECNQDKASGLIRSRLGENAKQYLEEKLPSANDTPNIYAMITALEDHYLPKGFAHFQTLLNTYNTLDLSNCGGGVSTYAEKLQRARIEIGKVHETCKIGDPLFLTKFLGGLGPNFDTFLTSFYNNNILIPGKTATGEEIPAISFTAVLQAVETEEQRQKGAQAKIAMMATTPSFSTQNTGIPDCGYCRNVLRIENPKMRIHKEFNCRKKHPHKAAEAAARRAAHERQKVNLNSRNQRDGTPHSSQQPDSIPPAAQQLVAATSHSILDLSMPTAGMEFAGPAIQPISMASSTQSHLPQLLKTHWIVDSGCTSHSTMFKDCFVGPIQPYTGPGVGGLGGHETTPHGIGTVRITLPNGCSLLLSDCFYSPNAGVNLISSTALQQRGWTLLLDQAGCTASQQDKVVFTASLRHGLLWV